MEELAAILAEVYGVIEDRKAHPVSGAYSTYLFEKGEDQIFKKLVSQSAALILAAKSEDGEAVRDRLADVVYHLLVLMVEEGIRLEDLAAVMSERRRRGREDA